MSTAVTGVPDEPSEYMTVADVAHRYSVSVEAVRKWIKQGILPARQTPTGLLRIASADAERFFAPVNEREQGQ